MEYGSSWSLVAGAVLAKYRLHHPQEEVVVLAGRCLHLLWWQHVRRSPW